MSVHVEIPDSLNAHRHADATGYHLDEQGNLHIRGANGNIAIYAPGRWSSAVNVPDSQQPAKPSLPPTTVIKGDAAKDMHLGLLKRKREIGRDLGLA